MTNDQLTAICSLRTLTSQAASEILGTPVENLEPFEMLKQARRDIRKMDPDKRKDATADVLRSACPNPTCPENRYAK